MNSYEELKQNKNQTIRIILRLKNEQFCNKKTKVHFFLQNELLMHEKAMQNLLEMHCLCKKAIFLRLKCMVFLPMNFGGKLMHAFA